MKLEKYVLYNDLGIVVNNKSFKDLTTMKVGGKIRNLYYPSSFDNLLITLAYLKKKRKDFFIIGNGSNIVASDKKYNKLVISGKHLIKDIEFNEDYFIVSGFMDLRVLIIKLVEKQIATLTNLAGIPATIGGAILMNTGAFSTNISDNLLWVKYIENNEVKTKRKDELYFSYRDSEFKNSNRIIIEAAFKIVSDKETLFEYKNILEKRRNKHPLNYPNSGSIFKNGCNYLAFEIIRKINLADYPVGGAKFSDKHANFIVNFDNAKAIDIYKLVMLAKKKALMFEKIDLKEEIILLNF